MKVITRKSWIWHWSQTLYHRRSKFASRK